MCLWHFSIDIRQRGTMLHYQSSHLTSNAFTGWSGLGKHSPISWGGRAQEIYQFGAEATMVPHDSSISQCTLTYTLILLVMLTSKLNYSRCATSEYYHLCTLARPRHWYCANKLNSISLGMSQPHIPRAHIFSPIWAGSLPVISLTDIVSLPAITRTIRLTTFLCRGELYPWRAS